jgi:hypothetical protein
MRGLPRLVLEGLSVATILANAGRRTRRLGLPGIGLAYTIFQAVRPRPGVSGPIVDLLAGMDEGTVRQIERFRGMVMSDTRLLRDLAPERMAELNERLGDHGARMVEIVTVAPSPTLTRGGLHDLDRRAVYALCHAGAASSDFRPVGFPRGPWIAARAPGTERAAVEEAPCANDGIVPAASQTLHGRAARIVLADHLDVVGHFESRWNTTLFKSGADFGRRQFEELWHFVAESLDHPAGGTARRQPRRPGLQLHGDHPPAAGSPGAARSRRARTQPLGAAAFRRDARREATRKPRAKAGLNAPA